jgi:glycerate kinase
MLKPVLALSIGLGTIFSAFASSDDAWKIMRQKMRSGCIDKANTMGLGKVDVSVDPFGTQSYGTAIIIKREASRQAELAYVCVMDKKTGEFEVSGELSLH